MSYQFTSKAPEHALTSPALLDLLDAHHAQLRFPRFSPGIAFRLGLALREEFFAKYGDEEEGREPQEGVKKGLGEFLSYLVGLGGKADGMCRRRYDDQAL